MTFLRSFQNVIKMLWVFNWSRTNLIEKVCIRAVTLKACVFYQTDICLYPISPPPKWFYLIQFYLFFWNFKSLTHDISCLGATCKAWEVPFPAIWEAFLAKFTLYATRQPMVALRLDSVTYYPLSAPGNPPPPRFVPTITPQQCFGGNRQSLWAPLRRNPGSATE